MTLDKKNRPKPKMADRKRESQLRTKAEQAGLRLVRQSDPNAPDYGLFQLVDVLSPLHAGYLALDDVGEMLDELQ